MADNEYPQGVPNGTDAPIPVSAQVPPNAGGAPATPPPTYQMPQQQQQYAQPQTNFKARSEGFGSFTKEKWPAAVLAFVLGTLGIHKFYLGYKSEGLVMLLVTIIGSLCFGLGAIVMAIISIIEAVKYVSLTEEDFQATYVHGYKGWM